MPTEMVFGAECLDELGARCETLGDRAFIITGKHSSRANGALDRALAQLPSAIVFDDAPENPTTTVCEKAAEMCRAERRDLVVAIGGGSPMDTAKAVAGLALNPSPCSAYFGRDLFTNGALPIVAVPTTSGSGSEVTPYSVLVDAENHTKKTVGGRNLFPAVALLDPELTVTMPKSVTASTGLDALSQAMEGIVSKKPTPLGEALALQACRLVRDSLPRAVHDGADLEARSRMQLAAALSGCVIAQSGTTLVHGMGYYFTLEYGVGHGLANGLLLGPLFRHNALYASDKVAAMAEALGCPCESTPEGARDGITAALRGLFDAIGVSPAARDAGVDGDRLEAFAESVFADPYRYRNQLGEITRERIARFFREAYEGSFGEG
jgi:alcohol dehydrogenase class IV